MYVVRMPYAADTPKANSWYETTSMLNIEITLFRLLFQEFKFGMLLLI